MASFTDILDHSGDLVKKGAEFFSKTKAGGAVIKGAGKESQGILKAFETGVAALAKRSGIASELVYGQGVVTGEHAEFVDTALTHVKAAGEVVEVAGMTGQIAGRLATAGRILSGPEGMAVMAVAQDVAYYAGLSKTPGLAGTLANATADADKMKKAEMGVQRALEPLSGVAHDLLHNKDLKNLPKDFSQAISDFSSMRLKPTVDNLQNAANFTHGLAENLRAPGPAGDAVRKAMADKITKAGVTVEQYADALDTYSQVLQQAADGEAKAPGQKSVTDHASDLNKVGQTITTTAPQTGTAPTTTAAAPADPMAGYKGRKGDINAVRVANAQTTTAPQTTPASTQPTATQPATTTTPTTTPATTAPAAATTDPAKAPEQPGKQPEKPAAPPAHRSLHQARM